MDIPKVLLQEYLGWSIFRQGEDFVAIPTRMQKEGDDPPEIREANVAAIKRIISGEGLIESAS